ncbi:MAG: hypothetical protein ACJAQ0_000455, partial [Dasania sp.]
MQYGKSIFQGTYKRLYDPMRGRRTLDEHKGVFKNTARALGISGLVGIDPRNEGGLFVTKSMAARHDASAHLSHLLDYYDGIDKKDISVIQGNKDKQFVKIGNGIDSMHRLRKHGKAYYIKTHNNNLQTPTLPLKIVANNHNEMIEKLAMIFNKPVARAKLELKTQVIPVFNKDILSPNFGSYILLNDAKIIPNSYLQNFDSTTSHTTSDEFDSALGGVSASQVNYHLCNGYNGPYSSKPENQPFETIQDDAWLRINGMTEHLLSSNITETLLGNIVNMYDAQKRLPPGHKGQIVQKLREDYIYNIHGKGTTNTRQRDETPASFSYDITDDSIFKQFEFASNPLRGGRIWRKNIPFSLEQTIRAFYSSSADGKRILKYDIDSDKFKKIIHKMSIKPADRQFMASHARKVMGAYVGLKLLSDEIAQINLHDTNLPTQEQSYNHKKWSDLNQLQDMLFETTGDMRDFLRQSTGGFGQLRDAVEKHVPKLVENKKLPNIKHVSQDTDAFVAQSTKNLFSHIKDYTYLENLFGWHARERIGSWIYKDLTNKVYDKTVPKVRGATAAINLLEGINNLSEELKYVETNFQAAANGKGAFSTLIEKVKYGDIKGVNAFLEWNKNRLLNGLTEEKNFPEYKTQALQAEGIIM